VLFREALRAANAAGLPVGNHDLPRGSIQNARDSRVFLREDVLKMRKVHRKSPKRIEHLKFDRVSEIMLNWVNYSHDKRKPAENGQTVSERPFVIT
jgi:hypothetical protein